MASLIFATQDIADFAARLGSLDKARTVLGNLNNKIILRTIDREDAGDSVTSPRSPDRMINQPNLPDTKMLLPPRVPLVYFGTRVETVDPVFGWVAMLSTDVLIQQLRQAFMECVDERKQEVVFSARGSVWSPAVTPVVVNPSVVVTDAGQFRVYAFVEPEFERVATTWRDVEQFAANVVSGERCFEDDPVRLKELWRLSERQGAAR